MTRFVTLSMNNDAILTHDQDNQFGVFLQTQLLHRLTQFCPGNDTMYVSCVTMRIV